MNPAQIRDYLKTFEPKRDRTIVIVDFANVEKWKHSLHWNVGIQELANLVKSFSHGKRYLRRFYYGSDYGKSESSTTMEAWSKGVIARAQANGLEVIIKRVKYIHSADNVYDSEKKCDLDVEMTVDLIRERDNYDTAIMFSGDGDLAYAMNYLHEAFGKQFIVFGARDHVGRELFDAQKSGTVSKILFAEDFEYRLIHPPEPTMYDQVLRHLETISHEARIPPKSQLNFGEIALATIAVCLRWGTYFAVLADRTKPIWPQTGQEEISMIGDEEMARINIEASAALAQWIEQMRADDSHFRKMVKAAQTLPMLPPLLDERTNDKLYRTISFINSAQSRQGFFAMLKEQYGEGWLEQKRAEIMPNPARWLANGLINAYWRNKSGIEDIHAGEWEARPLLQRRITPMQEYTIVQKVAEGIVPSMHAIYNVVNKKSEDGWEERALSLAINFSPPDYWSLTERPAEVLLEGAEP